MAHADLVFAQASHSECPFGVAVTIPRCAWVNALIGLLQSPHRALAMKLRFGDGNYICKFLVS